MTSQEMLILWMAACAVLGVCVWLVNRDDAGCADDCRPDPVAVHVAETTGSAGGCMAPEWHREIAELRRIRELRAQFERESA